MSNLCQLLSGLPPFPCVTFQVLVWVFFNCFFLLTDFLTEPRMSFYQKFSSFLIVEFGLFWPHNKFFWQKSFIHIFLPYFFFLTDNSVYSFAHLGNSHRLSSLLLLVALLCMSIFHMNRTKLPVSLKLLSRLVCITLKAEKLMFWVQCLVLRKLQF